MSSVTKQMLRSLLLAVGLAIFCMHSSAQKPASWRTLFDQNPINETKLKAALNLARHYGIKNLDSCQYFSENAYHIADSLHNHDGMAEASFLISRSINLVNEDYQGAIRWQKRALHHLGQDCSSAVRKQFFPDVYLATAITFKQLELFDSAIVYLNLADKSLSAFDRENEKWNINKIKTSLYVSIGEYDKACTEAERAWKGMEASNASKAQKGFLLYLMTNASLLAGNTELYAHSIERIQAIQKSPDPWDLEAQSPTHSSLSNLIEKKDISPTLKKVMNDAEAKGKFYFAGLHATNLAITYAEQGKVQEAIEVYKRAKLFYQKANMPGKVWHTEMALYQTHKQAGHQEEAFHSLELASNLRDSLKQEESLARVAELEVKYDTEKKSTALIQRTRQRNQWLVSSVVLLILAAGIFVLFQSRLRLLRLFSKQKERESQQALHLASYNAMVEGQEQERKRIAQDLHDGVGGALASLKSYSQIRANKPHLAAEATIKTNKLLDDINQEVQRIAQDLMPVSLDRLGLQAALADIVAQLNDHGTETQLQYFGSDARLSDQEKLMIYRIVQELCNNIRKHADADTALIQLVIEPEQINLLVEDDGKGFDWGDVKAKKSLGLKTLEARVAILGGELDIDARPETGTTVNIEVKNP
ncbi:MAG: sensor histidine kinase [Bacteroidia bacterium]